MNTGTETAKLATRTTEYRYNVDGLLVELVCRNGEEEQVTKWEYGVGLYEVEVEEVMVSCGVARNDLVRAKIYPDGGGDRVEYTYDRLGEVVKFEDQNGTEHEYAYDTIGRLTSDTVPVLGAGVNSEVNAISVEYTARGEVYKVASYGDPGMLDPVNEVTYSYNGMGQATAEAQWHIYPNVTKTVNYDYETPSPEGNTIRRKSIEYPSGRLVLFRYNATSLDDYMDRLSAIVDPAPDPDVDFASYEWLGAGTIVRTAYPEPEVEMTVIKSSGEAVGDAGDQYTGLDRFGRLEDARWRQSVSPGEDRERVVYGFDRVGNRTWRHNPVAEAQTTPQYFDEYYHYDGLYQVTGLARGKLNQNRTAIGGVPTWAEGWHYDEMGNWLGYKANGGGTDLDQQRTYNAANELLMIGEGTEPLSNATLAHDPAGNMTRMPKVDAWGTAQTLKWDAWNRLKEITQVISGSTVSIGKYDYDGLSRRIRKESKEGGSTLKRHLYYSDQWQVLEEFVATGSSPVVLTLERRFVWGIKMLDDLITRHVISGETTTRHYALNDGKNVTAIVNTSGVVQERYVYHGFGYSEVLDSDFEPKEDNESDFTWETRFCGYRWNQESGLYQVRYRYYHPQLGRWLSRDPIGEHGGFNVFVYAAGNTIRWSDPLGLIAPAVVIGAIVVGIVIAALWKANQAAARQKERPTSEYLDKKIDELQKQLGYYHDVCGCICAALARILQGAKDMQSTLNMMGMWKTWNQFQQVLREQFNAEEVGQRAFGGGLNDKYKNSIDCGHKVTEIFEQWDEFNAWDRHEGDRPAEVFMNDQMHVIQRVNAEIGRNLRIAKYLWDLANSMDCPCETFDLDKDPEVPIDPKAFLPIA